MNNLVIFISEYNSYPINRTEPSAQVDLGNLVGLDMAFEENRLWLLSGDRVLTVESGELVLLGQNTLFSLPEQGEDALAALY